MQIRADWDSTSYTWDDVRVAWDKVQKYVHPGKTTSMTRGLFDPDDMPHFKYTRTKRGLYNGPDDGK